jgi:hypothetical protein
MKSRESVVLERCSTRTSGAEGGQNMQIESCKGASACSRRNILIQKNRRAALAKRHDRASWLIASDLVFFNATGRIGGERRRAVYSMSESI